MADFSLFLKNTLKLSGSNILLYSIPLIVTPILSRLYTPSNFGNWGIFSAVISMLSTILTGCYEYAIIRERNDYKIKALAICSLGCSGIVLILLSLIFILGRILNIEFFLSFPGIPYLYIYLIVHALIVISQNILNRDSYYTSLSISNVLMGCSQALFRIIFGSVILISFGLIAGTVFAHVFTLIFLFYILFKTSIINKIFSTKTTISKVLSIAKEYKKFPLYDAPSELLAFATMNLTIIIISLYYPKNDVGYFSIVIQLLLLPISFIGAAMGKVYYQQISHNSENDLIPVSLKLFKLNVIISIIPILFLCLGGDKLIPLFLGSNWIATGNIAVALSIWSLPIIITQPMLSIYRRLEKQQRLLIFNILYFLIGVGSLTLSCLNDFNLIHSIIFFGISCAIVKFALVFDILKNCNINFNQIPFWVILILLLSIITYIIRVSLFS